MNVQNLINIHWMKQDELKGFMDEGKLYTETSEKGLFLKLPYSNILLHSAISMKSVWIDKSEVL